MDETTAPLDYAKRPTTAARIFTRSRIIIALAILITAVPLSVIVPQYWHDLLHWHLRNKCLAFSLPPSTVIFDDDPVRAKALMASGHYVSSHPAFGWSRKPNIALLSMQAFDDYAGSGHYLAPIVFLHERVSPGGHHGLVVIQFGWLSNTVSNMVSFGIYLDQQGVGGNASRSVGRSLEMWLSPSETIALYAGQSDPNDSSHFTIDYLLNNRRDTIEGWLNDDNSVYLIPRCGNIIWQIPNTLWMPGASLGPPWLNQYPPSWYTRAKIPPPPIPISLGHSNAPPTSRPAPMP